MSAIGIGEELFPTLTFGRAYDYRMVAEAEPTPGIPGVSAAAQIAGEAGQTELELMLVEYVCPPGIPPGRVDELRGMLKPEARSQPVLAELEPEWSSYDALLTSNPEAPYVG